MSAPERAQVGVEDTRMYPNVPEYGNSGPGLRIALQYNDGYAENVFSFANTINTVDGGTHLSGFRSALTRTINAYAQQAKLLKDNKVNLSGDDVREHAPCGPPRGRGRHC